MRYSEIILTEGRDAPLYHATTPDKAVSIIRSDTILGKKGRLKIGRDGDSEDDVKGVSLTRDLKFALWWQTYVFVLDQRLLTHTHRLVPYCYGNTARDECEEFVYGSIRNLHRYLTAILVEKDVFDFMTAKADPAFAALLNHPLLKVMPAPSRK